MQRLLYDREQNIESKTDYFSKKVTFYAKKIHQMGY